MSDSSITQRLFIFACVWISRVFMMWLCMFIKSNQCNVQSSEKKRQCYSVIVSSILLSFPVNTWWMFLRNDRSICLSPPTDSHPASYFYETSKDEDNPIQGTGQTWPCSDFESVSPVQCWSLCMKTKFQQITRVGNNSFGRDLPSLRIHEVAIWPLDCDHFPHSHKSTQCQVFILPQGLPGSDKHRR